MKKYFEDNGKVLSNKGMGWVIHAYCGKEFVDYNEIVEDGSPFEAKDRNANYGNMTLNFEDENQLLPKENKKNNMVNLDNVALLYMWSKLEPEEGKFYFDELDDAIKKYSERGKYLHFRISTDPMIYNGANGVPNWVFEKYNVPFQERIDYGCSMKYPDYLNKTYQEKLRNFLNVMADRYGHLKNLLLIDLRGYGEWGEWHSGYLHDDYATHNEALKQIIEIWVEAFKKTNIPLAISSSYEWRSDLKLPLHAPKSFSEFKYFQGLDVLDCYDNITFRRDGIAGALRVYDKQIMDEYFYNNGKFPITAEFYSPYLKTKVMPDGVRGYHTEDALEEALQIHPNFMMVMWDSNQFYEERQDLMAHGLKRMGFRLLPEYLEIDQINLNSYITLKQKWVNLAVGRLYYKCSLVLKVVDENNQEVDVIDKTFMANQIIEDKPYMHNTNINLRGLSNKITIYLGLMDENGDYINLPIDGLSEKFKGLYEMWSIELK